MNIYTSETAGSGASELAAVVSVVDGSVTIGVIFTSDTVVDVSITVGLSQVAGLDFMKPNMPMMVCIVHMTIFRSCHLLPIVIKKTILGGEWIFSDYTASGLSIS